MKLETRNAELEKAITEEKDRYARLAAEYDNYRKRTARELDGRYADAKADTWKSLLAVVDNFERALAAEPAGEEGAKDPFREGMELTYKQLKEQMEKAGVTEIEAKGKEFDPIRCRACLIVQPFIDQHNIFSLHIRGGYCLRGRRGNRVGRGIIPFERSCRRQYAA